MAKRPHSRVDFKLHPVNISIEKLDPRGFRSFFGASE